MTTQKPLVFKDGIIQRLQSGDFLDSDIFGVNLVPALLNADTDTIVQGQPVYVSSSGHVRKAINNSTITNAKVAGLCYDASVPTTDPINVQVSGQMELATWLAVTGTNLLTPGLYYFLDSTIGRLTTTAPTSSGFVTLVGLAITTTMLDIKINDPIQL